VASRAFVYQEVSFWLREISPNMGVCGCWLHGRQIAVADVAPGCIARQS